MLYRVFENCPFVLYRPSRALAENTIYLNGHTKSLTMYCTQVGLVFDIFGAILLFKYGLPSELESEEGDSIIGPLEDDRLVEVKRKNRKIRFRARLGLVLLIAGFVFQFIGSL